jgi:YD repeat-containing protein
MLSRELASYEPRGGRNLADQVRVNPTTGDLMYWETDLELGGPTSAPTFQRFYCSRSPKKEGGLFGPGWATVFERRLIAVNKDTYHLSDECHATWLFSDHDRQWWADRGPARRIEVAPDGLVLHDSDGSNWFFESAGWLIAIADRTGRCLTIERDITRPSLIRTVRDPWGNSLRFETDGNGLVTGIVRSDGRRLRYEYRQGLLIGTRSESGAGSRYSYDDAKRLTEIVLANGSTLNVGCDAEGRVVRLVGRGIAPRTYTYGASRRRTEGSSEGARADGLGNTTRWRLLDGGRRLEIVTESSGTIVLENNDRGNPTQLNLGEKNVWRWEYDAQGRLTGIENPRREMTHLRYSADRLDPDRIERADGSAMQFEFDQQQRCIAVAPENCRPWRSEYDKSGRLIRFEDFFHVRYEIAYGAKGQIASLSRPSGAQALIGRDEDGRIASVGEPDGPTIRFDCDALGRVRRISDEAEWLQLGHNDSGNLTSFTGSQGYGRRFYYTADGSPSTIQAPDERSMRLYYDGEHNCIARQYGDQAAIHCARGAGNKIQTLDAPGLARWNVRYDAWGRAITSQKDGYPEARLTYDPTGELRTVEQASVPRLSFAYAANGWPAALETPLRRFRFVWNPFNRLRAITETIGAKRDSFDYDDANRLVRRLTPGWTEQYRYDGAGRVVALVVTGLVSHEFGFQYDAKGWLTRIRYPSGVTSAFEYDTAQRLSRAVTRDPEVRMLFAMPVDYATSSRLAAATGGTGDRFAYRYDSNLALVEVAYSDGRRDSFTYDRRGGLATATRGNFRATFRHDALGRPTEVGATRYVYLSPDQTLPAMTKETVCLVLDDCERVVSLRRGDGLKAQYDYLPDGRMIRREVNGRIVQFDWDGPRLRTIADERGRTLLGIYYDPTFGLPLAVVADRQVYFCHPDAFGRPALLTDARGQVVGTPPDFPLEIKGRSEPPIGPTWEGLPPAIRLPEEGLCLVRGRLCEPRSGDFLSPDLSRFLDSVNPSRAAQVPRPLDATNYWDDLSNALRWVQEIEPLAFELRAGNRRDLAALSELASLVRRPEDFETHLLRKALREDFNPDRWFEAILPGGVVGEIESLPRGALAPPPSPAEAYFDFSPLGPIPYDWLRAFGEHGGVAIQR